MLQFTVIGNLGADARIEESNGRKFVSFNVAHTERWNNSDGTTREATQWVSCALDGDGGNLLPHLKKGRQVYVIGHGSVRVYSSPKERRMVAGLNISVQRLELLGGRVDDVPRRLYDDTGVEHAVNKAYYIATEEAKTLGAKEGTPVMLQSVDGAMFAVNHQGWITTIVKQPDEQTNETT